MAHAQPPESDPNNQKITLPPEVTHEMLAAGVVIICEKPTTKENQNTRPVLDGFIHIP